MTKIDFSQMTPQERREMLEELQAQETADRERRDREIETYKSLVSATVCENFGELLQVSRDLTARKKRIRDSFNIILELKSGLYGIRQGQNSHQFIDADGRYRIKIGCNVVDNYDDTVEVGIAKVRQYIADLSDTPRTQQLAEMVLKLLSKDGKGTLKASRVLQLQQMAYKSKDPEFMAGVNIIRDAYRPIESKSYIRAEYKDSNGKWTAVPLGMTEAE